MSMMIRLALLLSFFIVSSLSLSVAANPPADIDREDTLIASAEQGKNSKNPGLKEVEKYFIYRVIDDLKATNSFALKAIEDIESYGGAVSSPDPAEQSYYSEDLLEWYYSYAGWGIDTRAIFEEYYDAYLLKTETGTAWVSTLSTLHKRYGQLKDRLSGLIERYEREKIRLLRADRQRDDLLSRLAELERELARKISRAKKKDLSSPKKSELEDEIKRVISEIEETKDRLNTFSRYNHDLLIHYEALTDQIYDESEWLSMKINEYRLLSSTAKRIVASDYEGSLSGMKQIISTYEREISFLERKIDRIDRKRSRLPSTGDWKKMHFKDECLDYYERLKQNYSDYVQLLRVQIDGFRTDSGIILKLKSES